MSPSHRYKRGKKKRTTFDILLELIERWKGLAALGGSIYVIGFIVTARRLAQYDVPIATLINAQYFTAGLVPGFLLLLTLYVIISALKFDHEKKPLQWILTNFLAAITIAIFLILFYLGGDWFRETLAGPGSWINLVFIIPLGELCLWISIVILRRKGAFSEILNLPLKRMQKYYDQLTSNPEPSLKNVALLLIASFLGLFWVIIIIWLVGYLLFLALMLLIYIPLESPAVYDQIPQAYGGGKPLTVQLYVDSQQVPAELLDQTNVTVVQGSPAQTVPMNIIFKTSTEYIVDPIGDSSRRAWVLKADAVYALVPV